MNSPSLRNQQSVEQGVSRVAACVSVLVLAAQLGACVSTSGVSQSVVTGLLDGEVVSEPVATDKAADNNAALVSVPAQAVLAGDVDDNLVVEADAGSQTRTQSVGALTERVIQERETAFNPYVITAHRHNFILPVSYSNGINEAIYQQNDVPLREGLQPAEVKFQISLKTRLNEEDLLFANDSLSMAITLEAWWQLYSSDLSSPFRETNYQPEIFYLIPLLWGPFGGSSALVTGLEHQSNGQVQGLSRSWNRLYTMLVYERGDFVASIRPWYRLPEKAKENPGDAEGDDNPDILDFMGHGELGASWRNEKYEYAINLRGNPDTGKGAVKMGMTFPLVARFRGFIQYFSGYGDSLIDYNHYQQRLGVGVALTNLY